jgi:acyl dehydratase
VASAASGKPAGDRQWIHADHERATVGPFGARIAQGCLTSSLFIPLFSGLLEVVLQSLRRLCG